MALHDFPQRAAASLALRGRRLLRGPASRSYDRFFFVLGIGGSGTQWCAQTFTTGRSHCFHNSSLALNTGDKRDLTHFQVLADPRQLDPDWRARFVAGGGLREMFEVMADRPEERVGTADEYAGWFTDALHELHPSWRFLFVVRDGVKSVQRWVRASPWPHYQAIDHVWVPGWEALSTFERACHRWRDRNRITRERLGLIPAPNGRIVTLEDLTSDLDALRAAWEWLEIPDWESHAARNAELQGTAVSKHPESRVLKDAGEIWRSWSDAERETFIRICGADMELYGFPIPGPVHAAR